METSTADHGTHGRARNSTDTAASGAGLMHRAITDRILAGFFRVYRELGSGFLEAVYARSLRIELEEMGLELASEVPVSVCYKGRAVGFFRADLVIEGRVLVELKAADKLVAAHEQQVLNYLNATQLEVALLLNFGPRPSFRRFVLTNSKKHL
jgi:GxxExxY protein